MTKSTMETVENMNFGALLFKTLFSLLLVILLLVAFVYGLKWLQKRMQGGMLQQQNMSVIDNLVLGPKKQLQLVKMMDRVLLISSTETEVNMLLELDPDEIKQLAMPKASTNTFSKNLSEQIAKLGTNVNKHDKKM